MSAPVAMNVFSAFAATAHRYEARPFLYIPEAASSRYAPGPIDISYGDMLARVSALAQRYAAAGYGPGQRVGLVLDNRPCFFEHFLALNCMGASIVPLSAELRAQELRYLATHCDSSLIVTLPEYQARIVEALAGIKRPAVVIADAGTEFAPPAPDHEVPMALRLSADEAALLYTSGTTGTPKGCVLSNAYFIECGQWYQRLGGLCAFEPGQERLITPLPLNHSNALAWSFLGMVLNGGCLVQLDRFHPRSWWQSVRESHATVIHYLGVMPAMLLKSAPTPQDDFSAQIKFGFGAGVDPRHHAAFEERFGFPLIEAWAMTETGSGAIAAANREPRHVGTRCFGRLDTSMEHRIVDESGCNVLPGVAGEFLVRRRGEQPRACFFSGYYKDPDASSQVWAEGWFHTGDIVRAGADGDLFFVDRRKNIVRRSGENIAAVEVEGALLRHPGVKACAVTPVPDDIRGEEVFACVVLEEGAEPSPSLAAELFEFSARELAYYKTPGHIAFLRALPLTGSQKIQRADLRQLAKLLLAEKKSIDLTARKKRDRSEAVNQVCQESADG